MMRSKGFKWIVGLSSVALFTAFVGFAEKADQAGATTPADTDTTGESTENGQSPSGDGSEPFFRDGGGGGTYPGENGDSGSGQYDGPAGQTPSGEGSGEWNANPYGGGGQAGDDSEVNGHSS